MDSVAKRDPLAFRLVFQPADSAQRPADWPSLDPLTLFAEAALC
jgi:hypothetical protein